MSTRLVEGMAVEIDGEGPDVLFVHGLGGTSNTWQPQHRALAPRYRLIRPDLPGSGRSPLVGEPSLRELAAGLARLLDALGVERVALVGHSMGTVVCQYLAAAMGARVSRLALLGPIREPPPASRAALRERAGLARRGAMADIADAVCKSGLARAAQTEQPLLVALVREMVMRQAPAGYAHLCEALAAAAAADLAGIRCPALLVTGDEDAVAPEAAVRAHAGEFAAGRVTVLASCGHWASFERWAEVNAALGDFLAA